PSPSLRAIPGGSLPARRLRFAARRPAAPAHPPGRWSLVTPLFAAHADTVSPPARRRALAELLLERHGILTREHILAEAIPGGFAGLYDSLAELETLGVCRRGYFVEGLGGAQFALPGAVERLRQDRPRPDAQPPALVLAAADPAQPYGAVLPWPRPHHHDRRPARVPGAYLILLAGEPLLYVERSARGLISFREPSSDPADLRAALMSLAHAVHAGRIPRLALERIDGAPAVGSKWETFLAESGFRAGPRRLILSA
ncbi:MAG TPA: DEAD/DEAH box helicase, partial [Solirubrobacteraceae bacterium]|nr:DEAD/DEAH box helicase [Solirubrobacteraceae bacterium]